jgi:UDP-N-acetyl-D-mannosaminuronic acid dehydrogenase
MDNNVSTPEDRMQNLIEAINRRSLSLAVVGSGYVGLPTAALFADAGFQVVAIDVKPDLVYAVNRGVSPLKEPGLNELIARNVDAERLKATLSYEAIAQSDAVIISVQTPLNKSRKPNLSYLMKALKSVGKNLKKDRIIVVSSTVPPGTMTERVKPALEALSGMKAEADFYLAYVPERIAPGNALKEFVESPRLVGGMGPKSTKIAAELFRTVCKTVIETDALTAEVSKLAENTFRDVNIAFANQLSIICEKLGVDVMEVIRLANTHPRVNIHLPGPGVGGPCLPKDPYFLIYDKSPLKPNIITAARKINDNMPNHIVAKTLEMLEKAGKNVKNAKITVLGTAYKKDIADSRQSPSQPIIQKLLESGAKIVTYDPHCRESFGAEKANSLKEAVRNSDCILILTDHTEFKQQLNLGEMREIMNPNPIIVDARAIVNFEEATKLGFKYYGLGRNFFKRY